MTAAYVRAALVAIVVSYFVGKTDGYEAGCDFVTSTNAKTQKKPTAKAPEAVATVKRVAKKKATKVAKAPKVRVAKKKVTKPAVKKPRKKA